LNLLAHIVQRQSELLTPYDDGCEFQLPQDFSDNCIASCSGTGINRDKLYILTESKRLYLLIDTALECWVELKVKIAALFTKLNK
jgi:hypothetical protein